MSKSKAGAVTTPSPLAVFTPTPDIDDMGCWVDVARFLKAIGAKKVYRIGEGIATVFERFALESQIYPTRGVVAMGANSLFKLSSALDEPRAFSITLHSSSGFAGSDCYLSRGTSHTITFAPIPDRAGGIDTLELARRYAVSVAGIFENEHFRTMLPPELQRVVLEKKFSELVKLLP